MKEIIGRLFDCIILNKTELIKEIFHENRVLINCQDSDLKQTPLMIAIQYEQPAVIKIILPFKPDLGIKDVFGKNALDYLALSKNDEIQELFLKAKQKQVVEEKFNNRLFTTERLELTQKRQQVRDYQLEKLQSLVTDFLRQIREMIADKASRHLKNISVSEIKKITCPIIFLSYAWETIGSPELGRLQSFLQRLKQDLETAGLDVWLDLDRMTGDLEKQMRINIKKSHYVLPIGTNRYAEKTQINSDTNVNKELKFTLSEAKKSKDFLLPLMLQGDYKTTFSAEVNNHLIRDWRKCYQSRWEDADPWELEKNYVEELTRSDGGGLLRSLLGLHRSDHSEYRKACLENYKVLKSGLDAKLQCKKMEFKQTNRNLITQPLVSEAPYTTFSTPSIQKKAPSSEVQPLAREYRSQSY